MDSETLQRLNEKLDLLMPDMTYARLDEHGKITVDGRFTIDELRKLIDKVEQLLAGMEQQLTGHHVFTGDAAKHIEQILDVPCGDVPDDQFVGLLDPVQYAQWIRPLASAE
jgi:hypothetical protein